MQLRQTSLRAGQVQRNVDDEAAAGVAAVVACHLQLVGLVCVLEHVVVVEVLGRPAAVPLHLALLALGVRREAVVGVAPEHDVRAALVVLHPQLAGADGADQHGGLRVPHVARRPRRGPVLQPEHGRRQDDRGVEVPVREGLGHKVLLQPVHQRVCVHNVVHAAAAVVALHGAARPEVELLPSALEEVCGPLLDNESGQAGEEERVENGLAEHELHRLVLQRRGAVDLVRVDVLQVLPEAHVAKVQVRVALGV
mmetsp:Transcript_26198/g.69224  ORF Transcript_26198/g.69224 Transcript_26198/m.69224 type:complete len:253 (-) Transcript_26198:56-814(-)